MKNFNFKISNFYSIFNQMPDDNQNKNFDSFLNEKIKNSLESHVPQDFIYEMIKRVELEKEFEKEDVKTYKLAKFFMGGLVTVLIGLVVMLGFILSSGTESKDLSFFNGIIDRFSDVIESISIVTAETFGFAFDYQTGLIFLLVMICIFLFSFADKIVFKKRI